MKFKLSYLSYLYSVASHVSGMDDGGRANDPTAMGLSGSLRQNFDEGNLHQTASTFTDLVNECQKSR